MRKFTQLEALGLTFGLVGGLAVVWKYGVMKRAR
jgi:hypothetical protein